MTADTAHFLDEIDELLDSGRYDSATAALKRIAATVRRSDRVTEGQRHVVQEIAAGNQQDRLPSERFRSSRRYEGWAPQER